MPNWYTVSIFISVRVPADKDRGPQYTDQALAAIHQGNPRHLPITFGFWRHREEVTLFCSVSDELRSVAEGQLYAAYPEAELESLPVETSNEQAFDSAPFNGSRGRQGRRKTEVTWSAQLTLRRDLFPIKRYPQFEDALNRVSADPLTAILTMLNSQRADRLHPSIEITVRPVGGRTVHRYRRCLRTLASPVLRSHHRLADLHMTLALSRRLTLRVLGALLGRLAGRERRHGIDPLHMGSSRQHDREDDLQAAADKLGRLLFETQILLMVTGPPTAVREVYWGLRALAGAFGQFSTERLASFDMGRIRRERRRLSFSRSHAFLLSTEELATLWHPPTQTVRAPTMSRVESREREPPVTLPLPGKHPDIAVLGLATFRGQAKVFGILPDDRRRHIALLGKTGMGKSTLLQQLLVSDIAAGRGCGLIDPHGDVSDAVLAAVPKHRTNDVILFDAGDLTHPLSYNVLHCADPKQRPLVASAVLSAFKKVFAEFWGPRLEHVFRNALLALLEVRGSTLLSVLKLLSDGRFRQQVVARLTDPAVRAFWEQEFAAMTPKLRAEAIAPIQNKVGAFVSSPILRNLVGQTRNSLDLRRVMDRGQILIVNLSKGRIGDDASALLGSFLVSNLQLAAMSRAELPETQRRNFFLYVDEFQNFATQSFASILSEARKYGLNLTIANQYLAQMDEATLHAVFGNMGTLVAFQVGAKDAEILAEQLAGDLEPKDLLQLPRYHAYVRLLIAGHPSRPFSMETIPPASVRQDQHRVDVVRRTSRQRYARPVAHVASEIERFLVAR